MTTARAETKGEAIRLLEIEGVALVGLDYESAWRDASELSHLGLKTGGRVENRALRALPSSRRRHLLRV